MNSKLVLLLLTIIFTVIIAGGVYMLFSSNKSLKVFGCTEIDIYNSPDKKLEDKNLYCNLDLLEIAPNSRAEDVSVGLVIYNLNTTGYLTILVLFALIPFSLGYSAAYLLISRKLKHNGEV